jgi:hypothetical protein
MDTHFILQNILWTEIVGHFYMIDQDDFDEVDGNVMDKAQRVAYEMLNTEKTYVEKLHLIDQVIQLLFCS